MSTMADKGPIATQSTAHSGATFDAKQTIYVARPQSDTLVFLGANDTSTAKVITSTNLELGEQRPLIRGEGS